MVEAVPSEKSVTFKSNEFGQNVLVLIISNQNIRILCVFQSLLSQLQQQTATFLQKQGAWKPCFYIGNLPSTKQQWRKLGVKGLDFL
jgi:hypothetical protein